MFEKRNFTIREQLNWLGRAELEQLLEDHGFAVRDDETSDELRDAISANVDDGTIDEGIIEDIFTQQETGA